MDTNWSIEAGADDPVIAEAWVDDAGRVAYVDLTQPGAIDRLPEAQAWPEVRQALLILNAPGSSVATTKCDAWVLGDDEKQLDFGPVRFGFGAYFDILNAACLALPALRARVEDWARRARAMQPENARADFVIRPAIVDDEPGFAVTLYIFGYGGKEVEARGNWLQAMQAVVTLVMQTRP